jgi:MFS superfamily sulfate permease-like transporter
MFFGSSVSLDHHLERIESRITPRTRVVVMRMKRARNADAVAVAALEHFVERVRSRGVVVLLCGVRSGLRGAIERSGLLAKLDPEHVFLERPVRQTSTQEAIRLARRICAAADDATEMARA